MTARKLPEAAVAAILLLVILMPTAVQGQFRQRSTRCYPWRGAEEWRCAKRSTKNDVIVVKNISNRRVMFKVGQWESVCGMIGYKYEADEVTLNPKQSIIYDFKNSYVTNFSRSMVGTFIKFVAGKCNSFYVYNCNVGKCTDLLDVYPVAA